MNPPSRWLTTAAALCFAIALLHAAIIFLGPDAYGYFGAPQLGEAEAAGSVVPDLTTAVLVVVFATLACTRSPARDGCGGFRCSARPWW